MDEMKIKSTFITGIISKLIRKVVKKKVGCDVNIHINELTADTNDNGKTHIHLDIDAEMDKEELMKLLKDLI